MKNKESVMSRTAPSEKTDNPEQKKLDRKVAELKKKSHLPEAMVSLVEEVSRLQSEALRRVRFPQTNGQTLPPEILAAMPSAAARAQGAFLLARENFPLDMELVRELVPAMLKSITRHAPDLAPSAEELAEALQSGQYRLEDACRAVLRTPPAPGRARREDAGPSRPGSSEDPMRHDPANTPPVSPDASGPGMPGHKNPQTAEDGAGQTGKQVSGASGEEAPETGEETSGHEPEGFFIEWEREHPDAPSLFRFVVRSAVMPSLTLTGRLLGEKHGGDAWPHGHCPVCGSLPLIGRLMDGEGARRHTCSFCAFEYRVPRIGCPFCLSNACDGSRYYASEEEPGYRIDVCDACGNYLKIADLRRFDRAWMPLLDDLASLTLDMYARQMGYNRPTLSAWGF